MAFVKIIKKILSSDNTLREQRDGLLEG